MPKPEESKKELKLETVDFNEWIEIYQAGSWRVSTGTLKAFEKDIDEVILNFKNKVLEPYISLDHNPGLTKSTKEFFKAMSLGFVSDLKRVGGSLMAKFKQVPKLMAELIDSGAFKQRSVEWWKKFKHANGTVYNNVLQSITYHGRNGVPAISTLADIPKLFKGIDDEEYTKSIENGDLVSVELKKESKKEVQGMEISKEEYQALLKSGVELDKLKMDVESRNEQIVNLKSEMKTSKDELTELKTEKETLEKMKADIDKREADSIKTEANDYVDNLIKEEKLTKKFKEMKVNEYMRFKKENDVDGLTLFKEDLESRNKVVNTAPVTKSFVKDGKVEFKNPEYANESEIAEKQIDDMDDIDEAIKKHMKLKGYTDEFYNKAGYELGLFDKTEVPEEQLQ